jgi:hypothetical protein
MRHAGAKLKVICLLCFSPFFLVSGIAKTARAEAQIVVPGLSSETFSEAWIEGDLLLIKTVEGRLYSVPVGSIDLDFDTAGRDRPSHTGPTLSDVIDLLHAGVSEQTIKAFIESRRVDELRFDISKESIIRLKQAGASEAFIQYLIRVGRSGPNTTYIYWSGPSAPDQGPPTRNAPEPTRNESQQGIPLYPYVFPGFGVSYPIYPVYPSHPIYPSRPSYPGHTTGGARDPNLLPGATPGYYWPEMRSLMRSQSQPRGNSRGTTRTHVSKGDGQLWLRWKGGSSPRRGGSSNHSTSSTPGLRTPNRVQRSLVSTPSGTSSRTGSASRGRSSGMRSSGMRSLISKKK